MGAKQIRIGPGTSSYQGMLLRGQTAPNPINHLIGQSGLLYSGDLNDDSSLACKGEFPLGVGRDISLPNLCFQEFSFVSVI